MSKIMCRDDELVAVVSTQAWKAECDTMSPERRAKYPPDGTLGDVGLWEGVRIVVQDKIPIEWREWGHIGKTLPAVFL